MIIFNPVRPAKSNVLTPEETDQFIQSVELATRYNREFRTKQCKDHPGFISEVEVDVSKEKPYKVIRFCCDAFRRKIEEGPFPFWDDKYV
jgi:hypothetical protein